MRKVDFFIVGEAKSGTTALASFLDKHPEIGIASHKEPNYFATDIIRESDAYHGKERNFYIRTEQRYEEIFQDALSKKLIGEASTTYLPSTEAAKNIHKYNPQAKIIMMFREPAAFLHSLHMQYINETREDEENFEAALDLEPERRDGRNLPKNIHAPSLVYYKDRIKYYDHAIRYYNLFANESILPIISEDFQSDNARVYRQVLNFLEVNDSDFKPEFQTVHGSKTPRSKLLNRVLNHQRLKNALLGLVGRKRYASIQAKIRKIVMKDASRPKLATSTRKAINEASMPQIHNLEKLTGLDVSSKWFKD